MVDYEDLNRCAATTFIALERQDSAPVVKIVVRSEDGMSEESNNL